MIKRVAKSVIVAFTITLLCSCAKGNPSDTTDGYVYQTMPTTIPHTYETQNIDPSSPIESPSSTAGFNNITESVAVTENNATQQSPALEPTEAPTTTEKVYQKTGEMAFSDSADNKYIKAIVNKYGVNAKNLVALYTVPDNDGNIVLEFDGTTDSNGKLIRNKDTLISIYSIDKNLNSKRASEKLSLNEYSYGEMKVMFISTTKYIMPEFEAELNG